MTFKPESKIPVGIMGATGAVGQMFVSLLQDHPWFEIKALLASERSAGKAYGEAVNWTRPVTLSSSVASKIVQKCTSEKLERMVMFSALDSAVAGEIETHYANLGFPVFSNSRNHRMDSDVPLMIPEINADHFSLIELQRKKYPEGGFIVCNSNCSTMFLAMALAPLKERFGVKRVSVTTFQAISGAGYPGVASMDILGNVIPLIGGEEEKMETEPKKILGSLGADGVEFAEFDISAQCNRVPVKDGHLECISVELDNKVDSDEVIAAFKEFGNPLEKYGLPSSPKSPILYFDEKDRPQPSRDVDADKAMATCVGRVRPCNVLDHRFVILGHNLVRGAAGASLLNAEYLLADGKLGRFN
jgi:aspartate-semialdehyde dehydrogenase